MNNKLKELFRINEIYWRRRNPNTFTDKQKGQLLTWFGAWDKNTNAKVKEDSLTLHDAVFSRLADRLYEQDLDLYQYIFPSSSQQYSLPTQISVPSLQYSLPSQISVSSQRPMSSQRPVLSQRPSQDTFEDTFEDIFEDTFEDISPIEDDQDSQVLSYLRSTFKELISNNKLREYLGIAPALYLNGHFVTNKKIINKLINSLYRDEETFFLLKTDNLLDAIKNKQKADIYRCTMIVKVFKKPTRLDGNIEMLPYKVTFGRVHTNNDLEQIFSTSEDFYKALEIVFRNVSTSFTTMTINSEETLEDFDESFYNEIRAMQADCLPQIKRRNNPMTIAPTLLISGMIGYFLAKNNK